MRRQWLALLLALLVTAESALPRQIHPVLKQKRADLTWGELPEIILEKRVATVLPDGTRIEGEVLAVRIESLVLDIHKSSARKLHPRGQAEIPRDAITSLKVILTEGPVKAAGGVLGAVGGMWSTAGLGYATESAALVMTGLLFVLPIAIVGGYYAGKLADRRTTTIVIRPEKVQP